MAASIPDVCLTNVLLKISHDTPRDTEAHLGKGYNIIDFWCAKVVEPIKYYIHQ
jgi:hypothetical protein